MSLALRWRNKLRRRFYKPFNKIVHRGHYFVCSYFGADFLVRSVNVGGLEISAKIGEYPELKNFIRACAEIKPDVFIDIGANLGLYTCIDDEEPARAARHRRSSRTAATACICAPIS